MIIETDIDLQKINDPYKLYLKQYTLGEVFQSETLVNKENYLSGSVDIYDVLSENDLLGTDSINLSFEVRSPVGEFTISDLNRSRDELLFDFTDLDSEEYSKMVSMMNKYDQTPMYVQSGGERSLVINVVSYSNQKVVLVLNERNSSLFRSEAVNIYYSLYDTAVENYVLNEQTEVQPRVVLTNHRKENLTNYDYEGNRRQSTEKTYEELNDLVDKFTTEDYINLKEELNYSYDKFENHIRFGSAYSKVTNADAKIQEIKSYQSQLDNNTQMSSGSIITLKNEIRDIIDGFTLYEQHYYDDIWKPKSESEYNTWLDNRKDEAELYDLQNEEFILYLFPPDIIEEDETGYFTNFVLMMGEFFDNIWLYVEALSNIKEKNFYSEFQISSKFIDDALREMGINKEVKFTETGLNDYFTGTDNLKKVSEIISRRLLYNLPFLYKSKGTVSVIRQLINIFGIPENLLNIYEFGSQKTSTQGTVLFNDYDWYLEKTATDTVILDIENRGYGTPTTFEMVFNNLDPNGGNLFYLDSQGYVDFETSGSKARLNLYNDGTISHQTDYFINLNDQWTYVAITANLDTNQSGSVYSWQQEKSGYGLVNEYTEDFQWDVGDFGPVTDAEMFMDTAGSVTEFRIWDEMLSLEECREHADDFRSVAQTSYPETLNVRYKFYKPDGTAYNSISAVEGNFNGTLTGITSSSFKIDEFFNYSHINYIPTEDGRNNNVRIEDRVNTSESLTRFTKTTTFEFEEFSNDSNILGVFISPTDKLNTAIIRRIGDFVELVPNDLEDSDYRFSTLESNKKYLTEIPDSYSNLYIYNSLLQIFNQRIFKLLKDFVPASAQLEYGLLIKNHILNKVRGYSQDKSGMLHKNYEITIDTARSFNNNEAQNNYKVINTVVASRSENLEFDKVNLSDRDVLELNSDESKVQVSIKNPSQLKTDFYTKRMIKGFGALPPDPEEIEILQNAGASILVT